MINADVKTKKDLKAPHFIVFNRIQILYKNPKKDRSL
jgi:hypothetical protein